MSPTQKAALAAIDHALGPVGPGHHESHRTAHLLTWMSEKKQKRRGIPFAPGKK